MDGGWELGEEEGNGLEGGGRERGQREEEEGAAEEERDGGCSDKM